MRLPSIAVAHGKDANLGCASGDDADGVANSYGVIAGAGVHVGHNQRCPCSEMYVHAQMYTFWGAQNPVMAALDCPRIEYWVTLRYPIERIFSRVFKPVFTSHLPKLKLGMSADAMRSVLTNHTVHGAQDLSLGWRREFHGAGVAPLNNAYVRGLLGPTVYRLPLGAVTEQHLALAKAQLERIDIVLPLPNISQLPELLGRHLGRCMTAKVEHKRSGGSTSDSAWHTAARDKALRDTELMEALARHNRLDVQLYAHASELFERRMHAVKDPCLGDINSETAKIDMLIR